MSLLWILAIGFVVGALAKFIMPGKDPGGCIITTLLGIGGAFLANFLGQLVGWYRPGETAGFFAAVIGAVLILALYRAVVGKKT